MTDGHGTGADHRSRVVLDTLGQRIGRSVDSAELGCSPTALGLDSLALLRWRQDIRDSTGVEIPLSVIAGPVTVEDIVGIVSSTPSSVSPTCFLSGDTRGDVGTFAEEWASSDCLPEAAGLTATQQAYWAGRGTDFVGGGVATFWYHEYDRTVAHRSGRDLETDLARLETAWKRVVAAHTMLRTVVDRDARPVVARHDIRDWRMPRHDLRELGAAEARQKAELIRNQLSHQVRPTDEWPLVDVQVVLLPEDRMRLCVGFDALMVDFASWGLVMKQWGELVRRPRTQLLEESRTFSDILASRSDDGARRNRRRVDRSWWRRQSLPPAPLTGEDFPSGVRHFRRHQRNIEKPVWDKVVQEARQRGFSATAVVLTAFALSWQRWQASVKNGQTLNLTVFDRPTGADDVVGDFSSTALLSLSPEVGFDPQSSNSFSISAAAVTRQLWNTLDHGSFSGVEVARERPGEGPWPVVFTSGIGQTSGTDDRWLGEKVFGVSQTPQVLWDHLVWEEEGSLVIVHDVVEDALDERIRDGVIDMQMALLRSLTEAGGWDRPAPSWDPLAQEPRAVEPWTMDGKSVGELLHDPWLARAAGTAGGTGGEDRAIGDQEFESPALLTSTGEVGYQELHRRAELFAETLEGKEVGPGDLVLVALPKGTDQVIAVLGILLTGAGYIPADPAWPLARLTTIRDRTGLTVAVTAPVTSADSPGQAPSPTGPVLLPNGVERISTSSLRAGDTRSSGSRRNGSGNRAVASDLAYVIFTSGSTGEPKGVAVEHRQARTTVDEINARFGVGPGDRVLALSALSFDLSVYDIFGILGTGGALVIPDHDRLRDPQHWLELMEEHGVTIWNSAPPVMEMLLEYAESVPDRARRAFGSLRNCLLSGDWIPVTLPDRLRALAPQVMVHSLGGATEASIWSITYPVGNVDPGWTSIPYGRALPGHSFWILDEKDKPVCVGESGELRIGGSGVARGYIGADELTAERFIDCPDLKTRLYKTGDLGRWRVDGNIEFLGRLDRQVKIGGYRIELGEIEVAMLRLPEVRQAVVSSVPGPDGRPRLVAFASGKGSNWGDLPGDRRRAVSDRIRSALQREVPSYMVPSTLVPLNELPVTDNGKVDYRQLPNPFSRRGLDKAMSADAEVTPTLRDPADGELTARVQENSGQLLASTSESLSVSALRAKILGIVGVQCDLEISLTANGMGSLQLVQVANAVEDAGLPRPTMQCLLGAEKLEVMIRNWENHQMYACGAGEEAPEPMNDERTDSAPEREAEIGGFMDSGPVLRGLAKRLRLAADHLDQAAAEISSVYRELVSVPEIPVSGFDCRGDDSDLPGDTFDLSEMQLAYLVGRAPDRFGRTIAPHYYTEALIDDLQPEAFRRAWEKVVARHPMLRATITDDTRQQVQGSGEAFVEFVDRRDLSPEVQEQDRLRIRESRSHRLLPPTVAPMMGVLAVRLTNHRWRVHFDLDLLFYDAQSASTVVEELEAFLHCSDEPLPVSGPRFEDWVTHEKTSDSAREYWRMSVPELPDPVTPPVRVERVSSGWTRRRFELDDEVWASVSRQASAEEITLACTVLGALGEVLCPVRENRDDASEDEGTVMLTVSRRPYQHHGVVGDYTATMPLDIRPRQGGPRVLQGHLAAALDSVISPGGVHGNEIIRMLRDAGRRSEIPVAVSCALDSSATDPSQLLDSLGRTEFAISQTPQVLVDIQLFNVRGRLVCNIDADESVVDPEWVNAVFEGFRARMEMRGGTREIIDPPETDVTVERESVGPRNPVDRSIRQDVEEVFAELLGVSPLIWDQTWFDQGATSLTLVNAQRLLRERGYEIGVIDLFAHPIPSAVVEMLVSRVPGAVDSGPVQNREESASPDPAVARGRARRRAHRITRVVG